MQEQHWEWASQRRKQHDEIEEVIVGGKPAKEERRLDDQDHPDEADHSDGEVDETDFGLLILADYCTFL